MSKTSSGFIDYIKANTAVAIIVGAGILAAVIITGALAFGGNNSPVAEAPKPQNKQQDVKKDDNTKKDEVAVTDDSTVSDNSQVSGDVAVNADDLTSNDAGMNQTPASNPVVVTASTPTDQNDQTGSTNTGDNGGNTGTGTGSDNGGSQTPGNPTNPTDPTQPTDPTDPTDPTQPGNPTDPTSCQVATSVQNPAYTGARITLNFDDGWKSIFTNGLPLLQKYCLPSTQYVNSQPTLDGYTGYMTIDQIAAFKNAGSEIAWHTNTHGEALQNIGSMTQAQLDAEIKPNQTFIDQLLTAGVTLSHDYAAPFGTTSPAAVATVQANGFNTYRTTDDGYNLKGSTDFTSIKVKNVCGLDGIDACGGVKTTPEQVASWIAEAKTNNYWLVILFHEVAYQTTDEAAAAATGKDCDADPADEGYIAGSCTVDQSYAVTPADLDKMLAEVAQAKSEGVMVQTTQDAVADLNPQP